MLTSLSGLNDVCSFLFQPEPFFISLCLYDARAKEKISEDFHYDPNSDVIRSMIPKDILYALDMLNDNTNTIGNKTLEPELNGIDPKWIAYPNTVSIKWTLSKSRFIQSLYHYTHIFLFITYFPISI